MISMCNAQKFLKLKLDFVTCEIHVGYHVWISDDIMLHLCSLFIVAFHSCNVAIFHVRMLMWINDLWFFYMISYYILWKISNLLKKGVMFLVALVCPSVCLFVCKQIYSTSYKQIAMKFLGLVWGSTRNIYTIFGVDLGFWLGPTGLFFTLPMHSRWKLTSIRRCSGGITEPSTNNLLVFMLKIARHREASRV